jgi:colanic acid biosynthesis glycosyl transferase WcaI
MSAVKIQVDPLRADDARALAALHRAAFPGFFLSSLGEPFLVQFYRGFIGDGTAIALVARDGSGTPVGAVVGTTEPAGFFGRLVKRRFLGFVGAGLRAVVRHPGVAPRLARAVTYRGDVPDGRVGALLSSICVDPRQQGAGVGSVLLAAWEANASRMGARQAFLTTDSAGNDAVNRFYRANGWELEGSYTTREGRGMNRYTKTLGTD